jgi:tol-pal system protein YbgF
MKPIIYVCLLIALLAATPARAGTKEELMRLQSDVLALQNQIREFEKTFSEKTEGLRSLVVQLNDQVAKSNLILNRVSAALENQTSGANSSQQAVLQEIRNLSGKIDDTATRISALAQQINDLKVQSKALSQGSSNQGGGLSSSDSIYTQAYNDFVQGNFDLAVQGFTAYLGSSPNGDKAAAAQYYIGDSYLNQQKLPQAVSAFTRVVNDYPGSTQTPSALYRRAQAELALQETENAISDFKSVIERFPSAPESDMAKDQLQKLGVGASKPAGGTRRKR